jgi:hypothetical protein
MSPACPNNLAETFTEPGCREIIGSSSVEVVRSRSSCKTCRRAFIISKHKIDNGIIEMSGLNIYCSVGFGSVDDLGSAPHLLRPTPPAELFRMRRQGNIDAVNHIREFDKKYR